MNRTKLKKKEINIIRMDKKKYLIKSNSDDRYAELRQSGLVLYSVVLATGYFNVT